MISRFLGALFRAVLMAGAICLPALLLPNTNADTAQIVALIALFSAALTFFEYASVYPGLVEFRYAPPFNRIRAVALLSMLLLISVSITARVEPNTFNLFVSALGAIASGAVDIPYSPVRLMLLVLPADASPEHIEMVRVAASIAFVIALLTLAWFAVVARLTGWPTSQGSFNVWVNLPTFDPTAGGDVVERLRRDAWFNTTLGFLLPFLIPAALKLFSVNFVPVTLESPHLLIWTVTAWAFLPVNLCMRGIAMGRIGAMIEEKRRAQDTSDGVPA